MAVITSVPEPWQKRTEALCTRRKCSGPEPVVLQVGADICGFVGNVTEDLCVRWMQLGAFYPFSRSHNDIRAVDQDPAVFSEAAQAVMRKALQVRYTLMPYLYTLFYEAHNNGTPVVRPLFFEFPHEPHTYGIDAQFMWGKSLLISPITRNNTYMSFYLPAGLWYEYYDAEQNRHPDGVPTQWEGLRHSLLGRWRRETKHRNWCLRLHPLPHRRLSHDH